MPKEKDIVQILKLVKKYGNEEVLNIEELHIEKGKIYGLIGDNGAGKTTLFRLLTGLDFPSSGSISFSAGTVKTAALIEEPALDLQLTGFENLKFISLLCGRKDNKIIDEVLERVGLGDAKNKRVKKFSLGMKQRLGIAMLLLQDPNFLILDEPLNGVDPHGIIEFREIIRDLNNAGVTIIISSHILAELSKVATNYIFIKKGKVIKELSAEDISQQETDLEELYKEFL